ncbi:MAG: DUF2796 domain-containing protein [Pigmentiphaga sp.]
MAYPYFPIVARQLALAALGLAASQSAWSHVGAVHQHGMGHLDLAVAGNVLELQIRSPGMDLLGFEHEPRSAAEHDAVAVLRRTLLESESLVQPEAAAACTRVASELEDHGSSQATDANPGHDHDDHNHDDHPRHDHEHRGHDHHANGSSGHDHEGSPDHREWSVRYRYECLHADKLRAVEFGWFEAFPRAQELRFQAITPAGQTGGSLTPEATMIRW